MKKKWLWSLMLIVSLASATVWIRDASWKKQENRFHLDAHDWLRNWEASTRVYTRGEETDIVFFDESADSLLAIDQMRLVASRSPRPPAKELIFISMSDGVSVGEPWGFYLDPSQDRGWIELPEREGFTVETWKNYELAPETCRDLKKRIFELQKKKK